MPGNSKELRFSAEARGSLLEGVDAVANAVRVTLGPRGRNVALGRNFGAPVVTNDGVTVARDIELADNFANMGAQLIKEAASKTNDIAGDGTTTATVLAQSMVHGGLKAIAADMNPMILKRGIQKALKAADDAISTQSRKVREPRQMEWVGTISSGDPEVGRMIAEALDRAGKNGAVSVEEGRTNALELELVDGMQLDRGYVSPYLISDTDRMSAELEDVSIFVTDWALKSAQEILPFLERMVQGGHRNVLIIAEEIEGDMLATLIVNKARGIFNAVAIKAPAYGDRRKAILEDIAVLTKATVVSKDLGEDLKDTPLTVLGKARRVIVGKDETTIVEGAGSRRDISNRIQHINNEMEHTDSDYDREKLQERAAKLAGGVAVLRVGSPTEVELKEKKHRVEDALSATQAAVDEGIVAGAGTAFIRAMKAVAAVRDELQGDEAVGASIVSDALPMPLRQIAVNSGETGDVVVQRVTEATGALGFNGSNSKIEDLTKVGVVDPTKVVRAALQNAGSVATMILSTETLIADLPPKKSAATAMPPTGDMGMGMM